MLNRGWWCGSTSLKLCLHQRQATRPHCRSSKLSSPKLEQGAWWHLQISTSKHHQLHQRPQPWPKFLICLPAVASLRTQEHCFELLFFYSLPALPFPAVCSPSSVSTSILSQHLQHSQPSQHFASLRDNCALHIPGEPSRTEFVQIFANTAFTGFESIIHECSLPHSIDQDSSQLTSFSRPLVQLSSNKVPRGKWLHQLLGLV